MNSAEKPAWIPTPQYNARKGRTRRCFGFFQRGKASDQKGADLSVVTDGQSRRHQLGCPILIRNSVESGWRPSALNERRAGRLLHQTTCIKLRELTARDSF